MKNHEDNKNIGEIAFEEENQKQNSENINNFMKKIFKEPENKNKISGVIIGKLTGLENEKIYVDFPLNPENQPLLAFSTTAFNKSDIGKKVAIVFQNGNLHYPMVIGPVISEETSNDELNEKESIEILVDKKRITFNAEKEITLKCGKASITLTSAGKILIRGKYLLSRSSGVNKIKGGSVQIN